MSEMLANRYFLAGKYERAVPLFEAVMAQEPDNLQVKKKLVVCYRRTGQCEKAGELYHELRRQHPEALNDLTFE